MKCKNNGCQNDNAFLTFKKVRVCYDCWKKLNEDEQNNSKTL